MSLNANTFGEYLFGDLLPMNILAVTEDRYLQNIQQFVDRENAFMSQIMRTLADVGTEPQTGYLSGPGGRMQKMGKRGSVEATRGGQRWWVGFPIYSYGTKQIYEVPWLKRATFVDLASSILTATLQDIETVITELLRGVLDNANFTFDDTQWPGMRAQTPGSSAPINVRRLANADSSEGSVYAFGQEILLANLNHYLVSGTANPTIGGFQTIRTKLRAVGQDTDVKYVVSRTTADYIQANFSTDFIPPVEVLQTQFAQDLFGKYGVAGSAPLFGGGIRTRGRLSAYGELVEWPHFPDGYCFAYDASKEPPLRVRESDLADERGFQLAPDDDMPDVQTHPLARKQWRRIFGVGCRNRVNGVVMQFKASGSYDVPSL